MTGTVGRTRTSATSPRRTGSPLGVSISRSCTLVRLCRVSGRAPDLDVEHLLVLEEAADADARQQRGRRPADVARLDPGLPGLVEIDLDLHRRLRGLRRHALACRRPSIRDEELLHLVGLVVENAEVVAEDAHGDLVARPAEHLAASAPPSRSAPRGCRPG